MSTKYHKRPETTPPKKKSMSSGSQKAARAPLLLLFFFLLFLLPLTFRLRSCELCWWLSQFLSLGFRCQQRVEPGKCSAQGNPHPKWQSQHAPVPTWGSPPTWGAAGSCWAPAGRWSCWLGWACRSTSSWQRTGDGPHTSPASWGPAKTGDQGKSAWWSSPWARAGACLWPGRQSLRLEGCWCGGSASGGTPPPPGALPTGRRRAGTCRGPAGGHAPLRGDGREEGHLAPWISAQLHSGSVHTRGREKLHVRASGAETHADMQGADLTDISHPYST